MMEAIIKELKSDRKAKKRLQMSEKILELMTQQKNRRFMKTETCNNKLRQIYEGN